MPAHCSARRWKPTPSATPATRIAAATNEISGTEQSRSSSYSPTAHPKGTATTAPATHRAVSTVITQRAMGSPRDGLLTIGQYTTPVPAYSRLDVDERRTQLLEVGTELFSKHSYEELSMAQIA